MSEHYKLYQKILQFSDIYHHFTYFNPIVEYLDIDWVESYNEGIGVIERNPNFTIDDSIHFLFSKTGEQPISTKSEITDPTNSLDFTDDKIAILRVNNYSDPGIEQSLLSIIDNLDRIENIILDLRYYSGERGNLSALFDKTDFFQYLFKDRLLPISTLSISYEGFPSILNIGGTYKQKMELSPTKRYRSFVDGKDITLQIILNGDSLILPIYFALQSNRKALVSATEPIDLFDIDLQREIDNSPLTYTNRLLVNNRNQFIYHINRFIDSGDDNVIIRECVEIARDWENYKWRYLDIPLSKEMKLSTNLYRCDNNPLPHRYQRIFAITSIHYVMKTFNPLFNERREKDWDEYITNFIERSISCSTEEQYCDFLNQLLSTFKDGHIFLSTDHYFRNNNGALPISIRLVDGKIMVIDSLEDGSRLSVGDQIIAINGEPCESYIEGLKDRNCYNGEVGLRRLVKAQFERGKKGDEITLSIRGGENLYNRTILYGDYRKPSKPLQIFHKDIYYIDLTTIDSDQMERAVEEVDRYNKLIIDIRGYINSDPKNLLERLAVKENPLWSRVKIPIIDSDSLDIKQYIDKVGYFSRSSDYTIRKYIVVLINEEAMSWSETTIEFLKHECNAILIGSETSGINGNITTLPLPGNQLLYFTGMVSLGRDGNPDFGKGFTPDIEVEIGFIKGKFRDELYYGIEYFNNLQVELLNRD